MFYVTSVPTRDFGVWGGGSARGGDTVFGGRECGQSCLPGRALLDSVQQRSLCRARAQDNDDLQPVAKVGKQPDR